MHSQSESVFKGVQFCGIAVWMKIRDGGAGGMVLKSPTEQEVLGEMCAEV